jgi:hypothetical protein
MSAFDAVDGSSTGIAMFRNAVSADNLPMTGCGTKQSFQPVLFYVRFRG